MLVQPCAAEFMAAVKVSGLKPVQRSARVPLSPASTKLIADLSTRRTHIGLSRLARYASAKGIEPEEINDVCQKIRTLIILVCLGPRLGLGISLSVHRAVLEQFDRGC